MIIHLVGSLRDIKEDTSYLRRIIDVTHDHGAVLAHEWLEAAITRFNEHIRTPDWTLFVERNIEALKNSDVVIIEATHYKFSQGYQMAAALEYQKPVLVVSREQLKYKYITGFTNPLLTYKTYATENELARLVAAFLKKNTIHTKELRFNLFLTRKISNYLDEKSQQTGSNKSEIIRNIIKRYDAVKKEDG